MPDSSLLNDNLIPAGLPHWEHTLARSISTEGCGVHSGEAVTVTLHPAPEGSGIQFCRVDLHNGERYIRAHCDLVQETQLCTAIVNESGTQVRMLEHLMSAFFMACLDNVVVELDAAEVPILDGSAQQWLDLIFSVGLQKQKRSRRYVQPNVPLSVMQDDRFCRLEPHGEFVVDFAISYPHHLVGEQRMQFQGGSVEKWRREIAPARTFIFAQDLEAMRVQGLGLGGSLNNAVVIDANEVVNSEGLRFDNECLRHKILDLCGDLYLAGAPLLARVVAHKSGHRLNNRILRKLLSVPENWRSVCLEEGSPSSSPSASTPAPFLPAALQL